jgi:L-rhamnose-H+ transport protein
MQPNPFLGVFLHMIGGLASGSFYLPFRKVRKWSWESYWLAGGFFSWIIAPWVVALATSYDLLGVLSTALSTQWDACKWAYLFGIMWGMGGLTFGLTMRYLGMSLGMAVALGYCAAFGTIMPPIFTGSTSGIADGYIVVKFGKQFLEIIGSHAGWMVLAGVAVCLAGIVVTGVAGMSKEREMPEEEKKKVIKEFNFLKGILVATFSGIMSASMSYGIVAGKPIAALAEAANLKAGASADYSNLWQNTPVFIIILAGGFTTNFLWCAFLNLKNHSGRDYVDAKTPLVNNYVFSAIAGTTWYLQFMFYGMGTTQMGKYDFSSWSLHMSSIILFSTMWGIILHEWRGTSLRTKSYLTAGLAVLIVSLAIVGWGNSLVEKQKKAQDATSPGLVTSVDTSVDASVENPPDTLRNGGSPVA